ncbi:hypothetical protein [Winogradskyella poriferorum]|uniref:hypothetical protein n=1 Tax=Winogradskyella poriferorum TaxID=307627 RepID=UPI003D662737
MDKTKFFKDLNKSFQYGDKSGLNNTLNHYINNNALETVSKDLAEYLYNNYTSYKADAMAGLMQLAIQCNPEIALLKFPENYLFRLLIIKGSMDLYQCFMEEAIEPFLKGKDEDFRFDYYSELNLVAQELNYHFFSQYVPCKKGMDFNGVFGIYENNPAKSLINTEDYETLNDVVENYNTIIGRRDILKDLEERI